MPTVVADRLRRTMEEKRKFVPSPPDAKYTFMLCNRHLPCHLQLPEVLGCQDVSALFSDGYSSPLALIFQFCATSRTLFLDDCVDLERQVRRPFMFGRRRGPVPVFDSGSEIGSEWHSDADSE